MGGPSGRYPFGGWWRGHSIAADRHDGEREIARRLRQAERDRVNRLARAERLGARVHVGPDGPQIGLSRRGRPVAL